MTILEKTELNEDQSLLLVEQASGLLNFDIGQIGSAFGAEAQKTFKSYMGKASAIPLAKYAASKLVNKPKYNTFQLFSKDTFQKKLHNEIVGILLKSGNYKLVRKALMNGGELFELMKK